MEPAAHGLIAGLSIALLAIAFWTPYAAARVFHLGLGGVYVAVPFVTSACLEAGVGWPLALTAGVVTGTIISTACELFNHRPLSRRKASPSVHLAAALGLYIVLVQLVILVGGNETRQLHTDLSTSVTIGGLAFTRGEFVGGVAAALLIAGTLVGFRFSRLGLLLRAAADSTDELALRGYDTDRLRLVAFALSGAACAGASLITAYDIGFDPQRGLAAILPAAVAVFVGGTESITGAVLGGIVLGLIRTTVVWQASAQWQEPITYAVLIAILVLRPSGLISLQSAEVR